MSIFEGPVLGFDLETTGRNPNEARIVSVGLVYSSSPGVVDWERETIVDPGVEIPEEAAAIHGITTEVAQERGLKPLVALGQIWDAFNEARANGVPVGIYNAPYDLTVFAAECERQGEEIPPPDFGPVIDPYVIDKALDRYRKGSRTLTATAAHYGVEFGGGGAHNALADVHATIGVIRAFAEVQQPEGLTLQQLHELQVGWKAQQSASYQQYLRRNGKQEEISGDWPFQRAPVRA